MALIIRANGLCGCAFHRVIRWGVPSEILEGVYKNPTLDFAISCIISGAGAEDPWLWGALLPKPLPEQNLKRILNAAQFGPGMTYEKERGVGVRGYAGETFFSLLSRYSGPTWLIRIFRSRLAMISDGVVAEAVFKYLQHTQTASNCAIAHLHRGGLLSLSVRESFLDHTLGPV